MNKVPKYKECEHMKEYFIVFDYLYCEKEYKEICAGKNIKTSPTWCPLRYNSKTNLEESFKQIKEVEAGKRQFKTLKESKELWKNWAEDIK